MTETMGDTIAAAVSQAVKVHSAPSAPDPASSSSEAPDTASLPASPDAAPGSAAAASPDAQPDSSTTRTAEGDDDGLSDAGWLKLETRRTILNNAREKAAGRAKTEVLSQFGLNPSDNLESVATHVRALLAGPVPYYRMLGETLRREGLLPPDQAAQPAAAAPAPAKRDIADFHLPEPQYQTSDGKGVYTTEDVQSIVKDLVGHVQAVMDQRLAPHEDQLRAAMDQAERDAAFSAASRDLSDYEKRPRWKDVKPRVSELMRDAVRRQDPTVTLDYAYTKARLELEESERPNLEADIRKRLLASINQAPADEIAAVPGAPIARGSQRRSGNIFREAVEHAVSVHAGRG